MQGASKFLECNVLQRSNTASYKELSAHFWKARPIKEHTIISIKLKDTEVAALQ